MINEMSLYSSESKKTDPSISQEHVELEKLDFEHLQESDLDTLYDTIVKGIQAKKAEIDDIRFTEKVDSTSQALQITQLNQEIESLNKILNIVSTKLSRKDN